MTDNNESKFRTECPRCNREYSSKTEMLKHQQTPMCDPERDDGDCPLCDKTFSSERGAKVHLTKSHDVEKDPGTGDIDCPTCDKSFDSQKGVNLHHYHTHGESLSVEKSYCENCGEEITDFGSKNRKFCSLSCSNSGEHNGMYGREWAGEDHPRHGVEPWNKGKSRPEISKMLSNRERPCVQGENHPRWRGGADRYYGESWTKKLRRSIRDRDRHKCTFCGINESEIDEKLDIHHIKPFRKFGVDNHEKANQKDNLRTLCRSCHTTLEWRIMKNEQTEK